MATKIIYKGKTHYWVNVFSTKAQAEKYASKHRKGNNSVVVRKSSPPRIGDKGKRTKDIVYHVYSKSLPNKASKKNWFVTKLPSRSRYVMYDFARSATQAKKMLRDLKDGFPVAHKSTSQGGLYNVYVKRGSILWP